MGLCKTELNSYKIFMTASKIPNNSCSKITSIPEPIKYQLIPENIDDQENPLIQPNPYLWPEKKILPISFAII